MSGLELLNRVISVLVEGLSREEFLEFAEALDNGWDARFEEAVQSKAEELDPDAFN